MIFQDTLVTWSPVTGGEYGLGPLPSVTVLGYSLSQPIPFFVLLIPITVIVGIICTGVVLSPFGRILKGIREDEGVVRALGKNTTQAKVLVFGISCAIAGACGAISAFYYGTIGPSSYTLDLSIFLIAVVVLGGAASLRGTLVGAVVLGSLRPILSIYLGDVNSVPWQAVLYGGALIAMMLLRPEGLIPEGTRTIPFLPRRHRVVEPVVIAGAAALPTGIFTRSAKSHTVTPLPVSATTAEVTPILRVQDIHKSFGGIHALAGVTLDLQAGKITALIGPNGAGKTTLFNVISGELPPDSGHVWFRGRDITGKSPAEVVRHGVVRSFQDVRVFQRLRAIDNVALAVPNQLGEHLQWLPRYGSVRRCETRTLERAMECLRFVGASGLAKQVVGSLSYGEQKMIGLARLLASDCEVLLLDEPTSGMDVGAVDRMVGLDSRSWRGDWQDHLCCGAQPSCCGEAGGLGLLLGPGTCCGGRIA